MTTYKFFVVVEIVAQDLVENKYQILYDQWIIGLNNQ